MNDAPRLQIRQTNDPEILEFLNTHRVAFRLVGDHLFIFHGRSGEVAAGPGDWLSVGPDGEVEVERGDYSRRARRAITRARNAGRQAADATRATV